MEEAEYSAAYLTEVKWNDYEPERHKELGEYWLDRFIDCGDLKRGTLACQYFDCEKFGRHVEIGGRDGYWRHVYDVWVDYAM